MTGIDPTREAELARNRLLGWSLECEAIEPGVLLGRDIVIEAGPNGLDFARVQGVGALTQALTLALTTLRGDDIFNVTFGFDGLNAMVDGTDPILTRESIRVAVVQVLGREPRVGRILDVKLIDGRLQLTAEGTLLDTSTEEERLDARRNREVNVGVAFETISGEQTKLNLTTVGINV